MTGTISGARNLLFSESCALTGELYALRALIALVTSARSLWRSALRALVAKLRFYMAFIWTQVGQRLEFICHRPSSPRRLNDGGINARRNFAASGRPVGLVPTRRGIDSPPARA